MRWRRIHAAGVLGLIAVGLNAQLPDRSAYTDQPDAQRTKREFSQLLSHYPPQVSKVFSIDPTLLTNQTYLAPNPALGAYLSQHPEIARSPSFYVPPFYERITMPFERRSDNVHDLSIFLSLGLAVGLVTWLIRTLIDYRRWSRLSKIQTEAHTRILDRFTDNDDLRLYLQSRAGSRFLESAPIPLDAGPRALSAPLGRILLSLQAGLVLAAAGIGLGLAASQFSDDASQTLHVLGILGMALGGGFVVSAGVSFAISQRLGLIETAKRSTAIDAPEA